MRPGQLTPENARRPSLRCGKAARFNEAGAINPGKPANFSGALRFLESFNEAGAINPGKRPKEVIRVAQGLMAFNEAGAINPGKRGAPAQRGRPHGRLQ